MKTVSGNGGSTVPNCPRQKLADTEWTVIRSKFPFGIGDELGIVKAPDRSSAERLAVAVYGAHTCVMPRAKPMDKTAGVPKQRANQRGGVR